MVFEWTKGYRSSVKADIAGTVMKELEEEGNLTPSALVDKARPVDSPLHKGFEWDDAKAAEIYRRQQATQMIRAIVVRETEVVGSSGNEDTRVRIFHQVEKGEVYEDLKHILVDEEKVDALLEKAKAELRIFRNKYRQLEALSKVMSAIDELEAKEA